MLFKKEICPSCNAQYDPVEKYCPECKTANPDYPRHRVSHAATWVVWYVELAMFLIGIIGVNFLSYPIAFLIQGINFDKEVAFVMAVNAITYLLLFAIFSVFAGFHKKETFKSFSKPLNYGVGIVMGIALILSSILWSLISSMLGRTASNDNQNAVEALVTNYPLLSLLIIGVIGPIVEEFAYRVGLFSFSSRFSRVAGYVISAIVFGLIHFNFASTDIVNELLNLPDYIIAGVLLALTYDFHGLSASMTAHIVNNVFAVFMSILASLLK